MVTVSGRPLTRISRGSSAARVSARVRVLSAETRSTGRRVVTRPMVPLRSARLRRLRPVSSSGTVIHAASVGGLMAVNLLRPSRAVAPVDWNRWLVPPAALAVHLAIGQVYAWSVFKPPLEDSLGLSGTMSALPFQLGIVMLGLSAAVAGTTVERRGPRWAMAVATTCFSAGFLVSALGMLLGQYWMVVLGYGVVGGVGLGIGYISPVSTLMKWFPDRPGMATGIAIMGFGGGALIASPWSAQMLEAFGSDRSGIALTFLVHGLAYAVFMSLGVLLIRVPSPEWTAARTVDQPARRMVTTANVSARNALRTPQFWLLWVVLCCNVTAGIGILEKAAPMITDFFAGSSTP